jgi:hypothetical protein
MPEVRPKVRGAGGGARRHIDRVGEPDQGVRAGNGSASALSVAADRMTIMSRIISYNTADKADVLSFLGAAGNLTADQERVLGMVRERARRSQADLEHQGIDWGLSIPDALDHLVAGHADSDASYAAGAYHRALQHIIDCNGSDPAEPPEEIPFRIPYPVDGPHIGMFPLAKAKPAADAYRAVLDRVEESFRYDLRELIEKLEFEHSEWEYAMAKIDWYTQDTIFFSITG